ncbi:hypothetical protein BN946_scf184759.g12 [Trametes cinnabarina]|uniref:Uncharacterized protein n=1 Tax=Pycnoporus cinnabarinus TaxID=5643 RepID=A0A060S547_PYCCI|nr:hypothetical protein BN946_scf184759.g12 [Trametes cinnabarina]
MATAVEPSPQPEQPSTTPITVTTVPPSSAAHNVNGDQWPAPHPADRDPWLTFPPFPQPPPGVDLIPFSAFKPAGIQLATEPAEPGDVERDGLGIPTVTLRVHHDLTAMEKRKRKKPTKVGKDGVVRRAMWYEEWAEGEELRRTAGPIDPSLPRIDRLHQAAYDFKQGRPLHTNQELSQLWDRWRLYIGLISGLQPPASRKKNAQIRDALAAMGEAPEDDADDDEGEEEMPPTRPPKQAEVVVTNDENARPVAPTTQPASKPFFSEFSEEERQQRREYFREVRDTRMDRFLNDPETAVKIFLSGYYRDRGMIFSEKFCRDGPILLQFFLNFLLRNRVLPESEKDLRKAVAATGQAQKELPHSFVISRAIPDDFSQGCELLFGTKTHSNVWQVTDQGPSGDGDEPSAKRQKVTEPIAPTVLQEAAGIEKIEVVTPDTMLAMEQDAKEVHEDVNLNGAQDAAPEDPDVWDTTPKSNPLNDVLGATALPLTHTTGIVERSTRRVKAIITPPPRAVVAGTKKGKKGAVQTAEGPDAAAVERDLEERLAQVVLIPWHEWDVYDKADVTKPRILPESRGPAIEKESEIVESTEGAPKPHNPFQDEITLLVEPAAAEKLLLGVGVEATWIQLARVGPSVPDEAEGGVSKAAGTANKHVGAAGEPAAPTKFWYMEQVLAVLPSFHSEMVPLPTTEEVFGEA